MKSVEIIPGIDPKQFFPNARHIITYAFSVGSRHYFRYDDPLSIGYDRALKALMYYKEVDMNVDREFIKAHTQAFDNIVSKQLINIDALIELKKLNDRMKERLELPKEPELMYKLASVVFFDNLENPEVYEFKYGHNKINYWKKNTDIKDFFLQKPLMELIPYLRFAGENLEQFSQMVNEHSAEYLKSLFAQLSDGQRVILKDRLGLSPAA
jgi:hypothetical protein